MFKKKFSHQQKRTTACLPRDSLCTAESCSSHRFFFKTAAVTSGPFRRKRRSNTSSSWTMPQCFAMSASRPTTLAQWLQERVVSSLVSAQHDGVLLVWAQDSIHVDQHCAKGHLWRCQLTECIQRGLLPGKSALRGHGKFDFFMETPARLKNREGERIIRHRKCVSSCAGKKHTAGIRLTKN